MSTLEKVGWTSGIISAVVGITLSMIEDLDLNPIFKASIGGGGLAILLITGLWHIRKSKKEEVSQRNVKTSAFPILPEFRKDYHDHLVGLFEEIKNNLHTLTKDDNFFDALRKTKDKKRMIFQHLRTMDALSDTYPHLFAMYKLSVTELNDLENRKKEILRDLEEYDQKLDNYEFRNKNDDWIDPKDFKIAIGIKRNDSNEDLFSNKPLYDFPNSINCNLYIKKDEDGFKLGYAGHWFAKSKEQKTLERFKDFIYENGQKIMNNVSSVNSTYGSVYRLSVYLFNKEFKEHLELLEGEPLLGACLTCLGWFNAENEKKYRPILQEFNSHMSNYSETVWSKNNKPD